MGDHRGRRLFIVLLLLGGGTAAGAVPDTVQRAIQEADQSPRHAARTRAVIPSDAPPGLLGIPGAPRVRAIWGFLWALWVGWIFSTVGAFGGVMAGVGHITLFGLGNYAHSFGAGHPLNRLLTDTIRVSNQWLVGLSALTSVAGYLRLGRLVLPVATSLAVGSVAGSFLIPRLTAGRVSLSDYIGVFGLVVLLLGGYMLYQTSTRGRAARSRSTRAAGPLQNRQAQGERRGVQLLSGRMGPLHLALAAVLVGALCGNLLGAQHAWALPVAYALCALGLLLTLAWPGNVIRFSFHGDEFAFRALTPALGGLLIAALASFLGVGGGFLLVPFLTAVTRLPMFLVSGTSAFAVLAGMIVSIFTYMIGEGVVVPWGLVGSEMGGIVVGSVVGPLTQRFIPEVWLKRLFVLLAAYVGLRYLGRGFFDFSVLPPY